MVKQVVRKKERSEIKRRDCFC